MGHGDSDEVVRVLVLAAQGDATDESRSQCDQIDDEVAATIAHRVHQAAGDKRAELWLDEGLAKALRVGMGLARAHLAAMFVRVTASIALASTAAFRSLASRRRPLVPSALEVLAEKARDVTRQPPAVADALVTALAQLVAHDDQRAEWVEGRVELARVVAVAANHPSAFVRRSASGLLGALLAREMHNCHTAPEGDAGLQWTRHTLSLLHTTPPNTPPACPVAPRALTAALAALLRCEQRPARVHDELVVAVWNAGVRRQTAREVRTACAEAIAHCLVVGVRGQLFPPSPFRHLADAWRADWDHGRGCVLETTQAFCLLSCRHPLARPPATTPAATAALRAVRELLRVVVVRGHGDLPVQGPQQAPLAMDAHRHLLLAVARTLTLSEGVQGAVEGESARCLKGIVQGAACGLATGTARPVLDDPAAFDPGQQRDEGPGPCPPQLQRARAVVVGSLAAWAFAPARCKAGDGAERAGWQCWACAVVADTLALATRCGGPGSRVACFDAAREACTRCPGFATALLFERGGSRHQRRWALVCGATAKALDDGEPALQLSAMRLVRALVASAAEGECGGEGAVHALCDADGGLDCRARVGRWLDDPSPHLAVEEPLLLARELVVHGAAAPKGQHARWCRSAAAAAAALAAQHDDTATRVAAVRFLEALAATDHAVLVDERWEDLYRAMPNEADAAVRCAMADLAAALVLHAALRPPNAPAPLAAFEALCALCSRHGARLQEQRAVRVHALGRMRALVDAQGSLGAALDRCVDEWRRVHGDVAVLVEQAAPAFVYGNDIAFRLSGDQPDCY